MYNVPLWSQREVWFVPNLTLMLGWAPHPTIAVDWVFDMFFYFFWCVFCGFIMSYQSASRICGEIFACMIPSHAYVGLDE